MKKAKVEGKGNTANKYSGAGEGKKAKYGRIRRRQTKFETKGGVGVRPPSVARVQRKTESSTGESLKGTKEAGK